MSMSDTRFDVLCDLVQASLPHACICQIDIVENKDVEAAFDARTFEFVGERGDNKLPEIDQAFHGTHVDSAKQIAENGFLHSKNRRALHGHGTYFAQNAAFSFPYMGGTDEDGLSYMFSCDVRLTTEVTKKFYSNHKKEIVYIVPNDVDCIPRYLIQFYKDAK